jgi:hypothetical protein
MKIKIGDNIIIAKTDNLATVKPVNIINPEKNSPTVNLSSKIAISKLLKDPKIEQNKVDFNMDKAINNQIEITKEIVENESTLSVASSVLSAVKIPQAEPIKFTLNLLTADKKKENLAHDLQCGNYEGIVNNSVDFAKSGWGSAVSVAKIVDFGTDAIVDFGILSDASKTVTNIGKITKGVSSVASKIAIPFSVIGTGLNAWDIKSANDKVINKKKQIEALEHISLNGCKVGISYSKNNDTDLSTLKTNRNLKAVAFGFSAVSTATLIKSVKNPSKAPTYAAISLATSIASSVTSALADDKIRNKVKNLIQ